MASKYKYRRRRPAMFLASAFIGVFTSLFALIGPATASANSGYIYQGTLTEHSGNVNFCGEASIVDVGQNKSWALANTYNNPCSLTSDTWGAPAGYMGVDAYGFFNGGLCGDTGYAYNSSTEYNFGVGGDECGDLGCGTYATDAAQQWWSYYDDAYELGGGETSPNQSYYC